MFASIKALAKNLQFLIMHTIRAVEYNLSIARLVCFGGMLLVTCNLYIIYTVSMSLLVICVLFSSTIILAICGLFAVPTKLSCTALSPLPFQSQLDKCGQNAPLAVFCQGIQYCWNEWMWEAILIDYSIDRMESELQGCYILHGCVYAKELLAESERAVSATVAHRRGLWQVSQPKVNTLIVIFCALVYLIILGFSVCSYVQSRISHSYGGKKNKALAFIAMIHEVLGPQCRWGEFHVICDFLFLCSFIRYLL